MNINYKFKIIKRILFTKVVLKRVAISVSLVAIALLVAGSLFALYNKKILIEDGWEILALEKKTFNNVIQSSIGDVLFFQDLFVNELSSNENRSYQKAINHLSKHLKYFHDINRQYDQIRFIDAKGNEIIRTNWNNLTHEAQKGTVMQNKKHRYYFKNAMKLKNNEVYISPLDFNMEHQKIVAPYQPTIRVATPLILNNKKLGIIILNISVPNFIEQLKKIDRLSKGNIIFLSDKGYCLMHTPSKYRWSRLLKKSKEQPIPILYPKEIHSLIATNTNENLITKYGIFLCNSLHKDIDKSIYSDLNATLIYFLPYYTIFESTLWAIVAIIILFLSLAMLIGILWGNLKLKRIEFEKALEKMAVTDSLTGLMNRHALHERFAYEKNRATRYNENLCIAMLDIDYFKKINDHYGHIIADDILKELANILRKTLRTVDCICRFGGEEFILLLPKTPIEQATAVLERIRSTIEKTRITSHDKTIQFTISAGVTTWKVESDTIDKVLMRVDKLLYLAKKQGRNKVVTHQ